MYSHTHTHSNDPSPSPPPVYPPSDTHRHRLGTNYQSIPINRPFNARVRHYQRDGPMTVDGNQVSQSVKVKVSKEQCWSVDGYRRQYLLLRACGPWRWTATRSVSQAVGQAVMQQHPPPHTTTHHPHTQAGAPNYFPNSFSGPGEDAAQALHRDVSAGDVAR